MEKAENKLRVLVADDSDEVVWRLKDLLSEWDFLEILSPVASGPEALAVMRDENVDIAILDFQMPEMNCLEVLRSLEPRQRPPLIVVLSIHDGDDFRLACRKAGAQHFLHKVSEAHRIGEIIASLYRG